MEVYMWVIGAVFALAQLVIGAGVGVLVSSHRGLCGQVQRLEMTVLGIELKTEHARCAGMTAMQCREIQELCRERIAKIEARIRDLEEEMRSRR